jgi:phosphoribosylformimino-5-aminoimidazole carboxamide ribotide isomerase
MSSSPGSTLGAREFPESFGPWIFPAIDLRAGRCVRLRQGRRDVQFDYGDDPVAVARRWVDQGADCLHVIDLGAALGETPSTGVVLEIARTCSVPVQTGGGIRDEVSLAGLLEGGVARVLLGTRAFQDPEFLRRQIERYGPDRILVGVDCDGARIKVAGWERESSLDVAGGLDLVRRAGVERVLVTAIDRDGTLAGAREDLIRYVLESGGLRVVAAGGIGQLQHIETLLAIEHPLLEGVVVGRALYEGKVDLAAAIALTRKR